MFRIILFVILLAPFCSIGQVREIIFNGDTTTVLDLQTGEKQIFMYVEIMPVPPYDINEYLSENVKYPVSAIDSNIEGRVIIKFVVDTLGNIIDVVAAKPLHPLLDAEAIRVVKSMPKWKPGTQNGRPVMVYYTLPISFKLSDDEEK